jgi:RNA polymerase sigma-70 factor, ECF subfamily
MDDADLVAAAAAGDRDAFDELVRRHQGAIVNLARAMTGGAGDSEDLAQETFIRAWKSLGQFRRESTFRTWLHGIALNVIRTHRGRMARLRRIFFSATSDADADPIGRVSVDDRVEGSLALRQGIDRALARLPDELRAALVLRDVQGLEYRDIAEALGVPMGTVESRIFRARQRLRPLLEHLRSGPGDRR